MTVSTFPLKSSVDLGKVFLEAVAKQLNYVNRLGMWVCYGGEGIKAWFVYETTKGHEEEGRRQLGCQVYNPVKRCESSEQRKPGQLEKICDRKNI